MYGSPVLGVVSVATSTADDADCTTRGVPPPTAAAVTIASTTTRPICHGPVPISRMMPSPMPMPMATPTTSSIVRLARCPTDEARVMTAAIGAKNGLGRPITSCATNQAMPGAEPGLQGEREAAPYPGPAGADPRPGPAAQLGEDRGEAALRLGVRRAVGHDCRP